MKRRGFFATLLAPLLARLLPVSVVAKEADTVSIASLPVPPEVTHVNVYRSIAGGPYALVAKVPRGEFSYRDLIKADGQSGSKLMWSDGRSPGEGGILGGVHFDKVDFFYDPTRNG